MAERRLDRLDARARMNQQGRVVTVDDAQRGRSESPGAVFTQARTLLGCACPTCCCPIPATSVTSRRPFISALAMAAGPARLAGNPAAYVDQVVCRRVRR
jgi:hypothetical protein